jgi:hypothetical protein
MAIRVTQQSTTRNRYDEFHQVDDNRISTYAGRYALNVPAARCPTTFPANATIRLQMSGASWPEAQWRTDVETDLRGVGRFSSRIKCDDVLYNPSTNAMNKVPLENAPDEIVPLTFARLVDPPCTLRATGWNRFDPLFHNPQETFETPFDFFVPSRLTDKERFSTHKASSICGPFH